MMATMMITPELMPFLGDGAVVAGAGVLSTAIVAALPPGVCISLFDVGTVELTTGASVGAVVMSAVVSGVGSDVGTAVVSAVGSLVVTGACVIPGVGGC